MKWPKFHDTNRRMRGLLGMFCLFSVSLLPLTTRAQDDTNSEGNSRKGKTHELKLDIDQILALPDLWKLTPEKLEELCAAEGFSKNPYFRWAAENNSGKKFAYFAKQPFTNVKVDGTLFGNKLKMNTMVIEFENHEASSVLVVLSATGDMEVKSMGQISANGLENWTGAKPLLQSRWYGNLAVRELQTSTFTGERATACLDVGENVDLVRFVLARPGTNASELLALPVVELDRGNALERFCDLSSLLTFPQLWEMTPQSLEEAFGGKLVGEILEFQWLDSDKNAARFSRRPYSNVSVDLTLFPSRVRVEEMVLHFKDGKATNASVSLYNRGDSGEISREEFDVLFKKSGQAMIEKLAGVRPVEYKPRTPTAVKTTSWLWNTPHTLALLEYNTEALARKASPEFLRLRVAPAAQKEELLNITAIGQTTTTLSRGELVKFVKKEASGDVFVTGIPMVDQGAKGYCVVASCERLFAYLNIPCDQHELASIAGSEADRGTNSVAFVEALRKINTRFKVRFKTLLEKMPLQPSDLREARPDRFAKMVQQEIDRGVPLLWALQLGLFPEEPNIAMQQGGGHMRLIIGYNPVREEILFSDSWGAGHELKRMKLKDAVEATYGVYLVEPKGR